MNAGQVTFLPDFAVFMNFFTSGFFCSVGLNWQLRKLMFNVDAKLGVTGRVSENCL